MVCTIPKTGDAGQNILAQCKQRFDGFLHDDHAFVVQRVKEGEMGRKGERERETERGGGG